MIKYSELRNKHQENFNKLPTMFAFNQEGFIRGMKKLGLKPEQTELICSISNNGFILKSEVWTLNKLIKTNDKEMKKAMENDYFMVDAIVYELGNHEYGYTYNCSPVIDALELDINNDRVCKLLDEAKKIYLNNQD